MAEATTIKVPRQVRDRLQARAREAGVSMAAIVEQLLEQDLRAQRFARMRADRLQSPADETQEHELLEQSALVDLAQADERAR